MLILVRHGESTLNAEGRLVGRLDPTLTPVGEAQARAAGASLRTADVVLASPLQRAQATATLLDLGPPVVTEERLIEVDYGSLDGVKLSDVEPSLWRKWFEDASFTPEGGESLAALSVRVAELMEELFGEPTSAARSGTVVAVSHVSPIKAAVGWALEADPLVAWRLRLANGSITRIGFGPRGPQLVGFNEVPS